MISTLQGNLSLVPRPSHVFQHFTRKSGRPGRLCDVIKTCGHYLGRGLKVFANLPTQTSNCTTQLASKSTAELPAKGDHIERTVDETTVEEAHDRLGTTHFAIGGTVVTISLEPSDIPGAVLKSLSKLMLCLHWGGGYSAGESRLLSAEEAAADHKVLS